MSSQSFVKFPLQLLYETVSPPEFPLPHGMPSPTVPLKDSTSLSTPLLHPSYKLYEETFPSLTQTREGSSYSLKDTLTPAHTHTHTLSLSRALFLFLSSSLSLFLTSSLPLSLSSSRPLFLSFSLPLFLSSCLPLFLSSCLHLFLSSSLSLSLSCIFVFTLRCDRPC